MLMMSRPVNMSGCLGLCRLLPGSLDGTCPLVTIMMMVMVVVVIVMMLMMVMLAVIVVVMITMKLRLMRCTYNTRDIHKFLLPPRYEGIPEYEKRF